MLSYFDYPAPSLEVVQVVHLHHLIFRNVNENLSNSKFFENMYTFFYKTVIKITWLHLKLSLLDFLPLNQKVFVGQLTFSKNLHHSIWIHCDGAAIFSVKDFIHNFFLWTSDAKIEAISNHLKMGDSRAAVVISIHPKLVIAAYTDELDCVAMLQFPR